MINRNFSYEEQHQQLQKKIEELKLLAGEMQVDLSGEIDELESKADLQRQAKYDHLTAWEKVIISRQSNRPTPREYMDYMCPGWIELRGDRLFADDPAIIAGIGFYHNHPVSLFGFQKGRDTRDKIKCNFGMPQPEGYRKVLRLLAQAERFKRPVLTFVDTPGAFPGTGAEERGQAWAIAELIQAMTSLPVPIISVVTGEGGSGGALALAVADRVLMLAHSVFSVASPEACASILWRNLERTEEMANVLKITASDLAALGIIDEFIEEPPGGAQQDPESLMQRLDAAVHSHLQEVMKTGFGDIPALRYQRLRHLTVSIPGLPG